MRLEKGSDYKWFNLTFTNGYVRCQCMEIGLNERQKGVRGSMFFRLQQTEIFRCFFRSSFGAAGSIQMIKFPISDARLRLVYFNGWMCQ